MTKNQVPQKQPGNFVMFLGQSMEFTYRKKHVSIWDMYQTAHKYWVEFRKRKVNVQTMVLGQSLQHVTAQEERCPHRMNLFFPAPQLLIIWSKSSNIYWIDLPRQPLTHVRGKHSL